MNWLMALVVSKLWREGAFTPSLSETHADGCHKRMRLECRSWSANGPSL